MIKVSGVNKSFGTKQVLTDIDVELLKGKFTSIIGANGSGKSTLLSTIAKLEEVDSGVITLDNANIDNIIREDFAVKLAFLRQSNTPHMRFTIKELISFGRYPYSKGNLTKEDELKIDEVIKYFELEELESRFIDQVSGGQKQLAYIAMLAVQDTDYMMLDEPLNNLDIKHSKKVMRILRQYAHDFNKSIILVIHDINFAVSYSDYIIALKLGNLIANGETKDVIKPEVLKEIYEVDFKVKEIDGQIICMYY